ncbi:hypothetical protein [uncultured Sphaerotilus sp.]|uniref:hypothetical protein n=1 Tax=uncultured Sphaerotilus sp. TaxID=474984 RepID=UPI0030CA3871
MSHLITRSLVATLIAAACALTAGSALAATKKAKAEAAPPAPLAELSPEQIANAERVLVGAQHCEFNQTISVESAPEKAGYFRIAFKGKKYLLVPEPTTTGAVRLEDKKAGVVWLQIANKSMMMNSKIGQRMVDECIHPTQKI